MPPSQGAHLRTQALHRRCPGSHRHKRPARSRMCCLAHSIPGRKGSKSNSWRVGGRSGLNMLLFRSRRLPEVQGRRVSWCHFVWWSSRDRICAVGKGWVLVVRKPSDDVTRRGWDRGCAVAGTAAAVQPAAWSLEARVSLQGSRPSRRGSQLGIVAQALPPSLSNTETALPIPIDPLDKTRCMPRHVPGGCKLRCPRRWYAPHDGWDQAG